MKIVLPSGFPPAPGRGLFNPAERKRMRALVFTFALVCVSLFVLIRRERDRIRQEQEKLAASQAEETPGEVQAVVVTPQIDVARLESLVRDRTAEERALLEPAALAQAFLDARLIGDTLFESMQGRELDAALASSIAAAPQPERGKLLRCRGWADHVMRYAAAGNLPEHTRGRLRLEGGGHAWFAVLSEPDGGVLEGDFVRVDGIFVEVFRSEGASAGEWIDAPLMAGPRALRSHPRLEPVRELDPLDFEGIQDDSLENGITGQPYDALWTLVSYVQQLPPDAVDWSQAPVLDRATMAQLVADGSRFRARPMRVPASQVMDSWIKAQDDNPPRLARMTEGWLGREDWRGPGNGLVRYVSPFELREIERGQAVLAQGFFLKNLAYEPRDGGIAIAPFFVLHSIQIHTAVEDKTWRRILLGFSGGVLLLGGVIYFMLLRDRRGSAALQAELLERRRARRRTQVRS